MQFLSIPGLGETKTALIKGIQSGRLSHALLFHGHAGGAAFPLARALTQYVLCEDPGPSDSCGRCGNCLRVAKGIHPDVHYFFPAGSMGKDAEYEKKLGDQLHHFRSFMSESPFGLIEDWTQRAGMDNKNLLIGKQDSRRILQVVSMKPVEGQHKFILIWLPEYFNASSANAILKVLEEPPEKTTFILISHHYDSLLQTITSRSVLFQVPGNEMDELIPFLEEMGADHPTRTAQLAQGSIGHALRMANHPEEMDYTPFRTWMLACVKQSFDELMGLAEQFAQEDKRLQRARLQTGLHVIENLLIERRTKEDAFLTKFADFLAGTKKRQAYALINEALVHLTRNANAKMVHFHLSFEFVKLLRA